jgi:hypothetical protein
MVINMEIQFLDVLKYIFFGLLQGIAEVIPISSSGHLQIASEILKLNDESDEIFELLENTVWSRDYDELLVEGCDTIWTEIIPSYCRDHDLNPDDDDEYDEGREILFEDDEMFSDYVDYYIEENY